MNRCKLCGYLGEGCGGGTRYRPQCPQKRPSLITQPEDDGVIVIDYRESEQ